ncbi:MAG: hypothetical protein EHM15_00515 [Desulfobacteraceae bacterium]|nr:MAG: hypothetical protein EHM15_00515 [Desulfobacteraceae bacterium]
MSQHTPSPPSQPSGAPGRRVLVPAGTLAAAGLAVFFLGAAGADPGRAWQAFLINFLLWSSIAQGAVLFSAVTRITRARWSGPLDGLSGAFAGFFPLSFLLFLALAFGGPHVFPWMHADLHGKESWLNVPFVLARNGVGLLILYGIGFMFLRQALRLRLAPAAGGTGVRRLLAGGAPADAAEAERIQARMTRWAGLYCFAFALVLSLAGFDLVMAMDPHWYSTLFGAYHFVKAFYLGLGALIILAALLALRRGGAPGLESRHFHDIGKLFFAFCLLWADFFYVQLTVIWYGNIPEETHYVILRTVLPPWRPLAWTVFSMVFIIPFIVLINKRIKTVPAAILTLCSLVIVGLWLELLLLVGPPLNHGAAELPLGLSDAILFLGFLGLMVMAVSAMLRTFPELLPPAQPVRS